MTDLSLISQFLTGPDWPLAWAILLLAFVTGVIITWLIWRGKVRSLEKQVNNEKALALQYETQLKKTEEELELKESDLKKAGLANLKVSQDLDVMAAQKEDFKTELAVAKDQVKNVGTLNQQHKQSIEDLENQILGLKTKNNDLSAKVESGISANTNVEVYTLKTKLTKTNAELATAKVAIKNLEEERVSLKKAAATAQAAASTQATSTQNGVASQPVVKRVVRKSAPAKKTETIAKKPAATTKRITKTLRKPAAKKVVAKKAAPAKRTVKKVEKERLRKIEGIGPKIEELLHNAGILSFKQLSKTKADKLKKILADGGSRYKMHDPTTWPEQSAMAAKGDWDKLKTYQDFLKGGVDTSKK